MSKKCIIAKEFKALIEEDGATRAAINGYILRKRAKNADMRKVVEAMAEYAWSLRDEHLLCETLLLCDGADIMRRLSDVTKEICGPEVWQKVFAGKQIPGIGTTLDEMNDFTLEMDRAFLATAPREDYERACEKVAHCWEPSWNPITHEEFLALGSIDALCDWLNAKTIAELEQCRDKDEPFFNQMVDDEVIEYSKAHPNYYRKGDKLYVEKIPFLAKKFLAEPGGKMKRYYACHCPLARESILREDGPVSRSFCHCSLGYSKKPFEAAFDRELTGRTVSVVFDEDCYQCVFEIDIPEDILAMHT